jgi:predicted transposase YbfD/YdcC
MYEGKFFEEFMIIEDIREQGKVKHKLIDIIFLVVSAVICNCNEWKDIALWCRMKTNQEWLKKHIELANGMPSLSTIGRLFNIISPKQFEKCFANWMKRAVELPEGDVVSIDGKTMRGTIEEGSTKGVHIVSAICKSYNLVIGQNKTSEKSNEITAIPELLDMLNLKGCVVTIDAMGCQKKIAKKIAKECKADYVLNVKSNQPSLLDDIVQHFQNEDMIEIIKNINSEYKVNGESLDFEDIKLSMVKTVEKGHGRIEKRSYYYSNDLTLLIDAKKEWHSLKGIGMVKREVEEKGKTSIEYSYHIASVDNIMQFEKAVRGHWAVESMHWSLDVTYKDDANKTRKGTSPQNMALLKRIAFNAVKKDITKYPKESMKGKRFIATYDLEYRDYIINLNFGKN